MIGEPSTSRGTTCPETSARVHVSPPSTPPRNISCVRRDTEGTYSHEQVQRGMAAITRLPSVGFNN